LVEIDELARGRIHRGAHLGQHQTAAMHRAHAAAIDERAHAKRPIGVGNRSRLGHVTSGMESGKYNRSIARVVQRRVLPAVLCLAAATVATPARAQSVAGTLNAFGLFGTW